MKIVRIKNSIEKFRPYFTDGDISAAREDDETHPNANAKNDPEFAKQQNKIQPLQNRFNEGRVSRSRREWWCENYISKKPPRP